MLAASLKASRQGGVTTRRALFCLAACIFLRIARGALIGHRRAARDSDEAGEQQGREERDRQSFALETHIDLPR